MLSFDKIQSLGVRAVRQQFQQQLGRLCCPDPGSNGSILVTIYFSIYNYIIFRMFYFGNKFFLNHVADFLQLHLQKVLFLLHDLSQLCGGFFTTTSSSKGSILVTRSFSIYNYIFFKMFNFCDKIFLNHVADFLQLHLPQNVLFW